MEFELIDIHCHMMPLVDDGASDWAVAEQMLRMAYDEGIRGVIATPHYRDGHRNVPAEQLETNWIRMKEIAQGIDPSYHIYLGNELYYCSEAVNLCNENVVRTLAQSFYVLVEFSPARDFNYIKRALQQLQVGGYTPVLAHVERYQCLLKDISLVDELYEMGVCIQSNVSAIMGDNGRKERSFTKKLLKYEYIHVVGTDSHNLDKRPPQMRKCVEYIQKKYGAGYARALFNENPRKIIQNEHLVGN